MLLYASHTSFLRAASTVVSSLCCGGLAGLCKRIGGVPSAVNLTDMATKVISIVNTDQVSHYVQLCLCLIVHSCTM